MWEKIKKWSNFVVAPIGILLAYFFGRKSGKAATNRDINDLRRYNEELKTKLRSMESRLEEFKNISRENQERLSSIAEQQRETDEIIGRAEQGYIATESELERLDKNNKKLRELIELL